MGSRGRSSNLFQSNGEKKPLRSSASKLVDEITRELAGRRPDPESRKPPFILDVITDPSWFGPWFPLSWDAWRVFLAALFGVPVSEDNLQLYRECTGRTEFPTREAREAWVVVGRRGGKSVIAALIAIYLAAFREYSHILAPGEVGTIPLIAADRKESRTVLRYISGLINRIAALKEMVVRQTSDAIEFRNRVVIELHTANYRAVRGYTVVAATCDELAFWRTDEQSANPDSEIIAALRPGMATVPGSMLIAISSPHARRGHSGTTIAGISAKTVTQSWSGRPPAWS